MADDGDCDVASNGEVFEDVVSDPGSIIDNVESCSKILIPSMAQHSMSKLTTNEHEDHENNGIFHQTIKRDTDDDDDDVVDENHRATDHINVEERSEPLHRTFSISKQEIAGSPRTVKWTLETMVEAMDSVFSGELTTTSAARKYEIPRTTLLDRLALKARRQHFEAPGSFPLNAENDAQVVNFVRRNERMDKPTLIKGMINLAEELARMQARAFDNPLSTRKWLKLFIQKHPELEVLRYIRPRTASSRSSVSMLTSSQVNANHKNSITNSSAHEVALSQQIIIQPYSTPVSNGPLVTTNINNSTDDLSDHDDKSPEQENRHLQFDSLEASLAKQGAKAIEEKLTTEQLHYFKYRYTSKHLDRGFELWKLCKSQADSGDTLAVLGLNGVEQGLTQEHLKYFLFRYENTDLEEGYKLWSYMTEKIYN